MAFVLDPAGLVSVLSGAGLLALGLAVLGLRPRSRASRYFAYAALLWGAAVAASGLSLLTDDLGVARAWTLVFLLLHVPLFVPLWSFVASYPWPSRRIFASTFSRTTLVLAAIALLAAFVVKPSWFLEDVFLVDGLPSASFGPLYTPIVTGNAHLAFAVAFGIVAYRLVRARNEAETAQLALVAAGLLFYLSYRSANIVPTAITEAGSLWESLGASEYLLRLLMFTATSVGVLLGIAIAIIRRNLPFRPLFVVASILPFLVGVVEIYAEVPAAYRTFGLWRIVAVGLFAYGIARWRMFDLDVKIKLTVSRGFVGAIFVAVFFAVYEGSQAFFQSTTGSSVIAILAASLLVFALSPLQRLAERVSHAALPIDTSSQYLVYRKLQVYRAAYEEATNGGVSAKERGMLERLRTELGIASADAAALEREVQRAQATGL